MAAVFILLFLLIAFFVWGIVRTINSPDTSSRNYTPEPPKQNKSMEELFTVEKGYFTESYLHRNDKKHDRHKRNQTPW